MPEEKPSTPIEATEAMDSKAQTEKKPRKKAAKSKKAQAAETQDQQIETLNAEITALKEQLLREQAELVNFKRRMTDEKIKDRRFANAGLLKSLLPVLDHLEAALKVEAEKEAFKPFLPGFEKLHENFLTALKESGLEPVDALDKPFDPTLHEAVMQEEKDGVEAGIVIEEFQKGYLYHERILRPSMVKVSE